MAIITLNNRSINRSDTASADQVWTATSATASDFQAGGGGIILQVIQANKLDTYNQTTASWTDITDISVAITPASSSNKIFVMVSLNTSKASGGGNGSFRLLRDSTVIGAGTGGDTYNGFGMTDQAQNSNYMSVKSAQVLDSPSSTSELTYKVQLYNITTGYASYINQRSLGTGHGANSSITVMEVAV